MKVMIWGCGAIGKRLYNKLLQSKSEYEVIGFIDQNASSFEGTNYNVISPEEVVRLYDIGEFEKVIIGLSEKYKEVVENRLKSQKIPYMDYKLLYVNTSDIKKYKFIHLTYNDKFCVPFIRDFNKEFNIKDHAFIVQRMLKDFPFPEAENVYELDDINDLDFSDSHIEKVICHSLFLSNIVDYLYKHQTVQKQKVYWMMYGADLYNASRDLINDMVRANFKGYISDTDGDNEIVREKYKVDNALFFDASYSFPIDLEMIDNAKKGRQKKDSIRIQINNSCDKSTIEMLKILSRFSDEKIIVTTITSYAQVEYRDEIISLGKELFNDKFEYMDNLLSPAEYAKWMANNDILILNQDRQQGLGNSLAALAMGVKVYIKSSVTTYSHFNNDGIKVYDTLKINDMSFEEFVHHDDEVRDSNEGKVEKFFTSEFLKEKWEKIFR